MENYNNLPIEFEKISNVLDDRFIKVKIWIAHTGENRNNSIFSREVLESMIPSLSNTMILGYIAVDENGNADFKGHETKLVIENGEFDIKYVGRAWGVIPETHNARFESRYGEDGVEREYLVCEGLLWRKFPEVEEIFDRDGGYKSQSMELFPPSVKGYVNEFGQFVFTEAKFEGACILGEGVTPAMISSTIEKFSVANNIKTEFSEMLTEFNAYFSQSIQKGDDQVEDNQNPIVEPATPVTEPATPENFTEPTVEPEVTPEPTTEPETEFTEPATEPAEPETDFADKTKEDDEDEDDKEDDKEDEDKKEKFTVTFELSHDDIRSSLYSALGEHDSFKEGWSYISKVFDSHAVIEHETYTEDSYDVKFYKVNYVKHENAVSLGEHEELFPMFLTQNEKSAIDSSRNNFEAMEQEVISLREFKANVELAEKEAKLNSYASTLSTEEFETIKSNLSNFSITDIEKEIGFMLLKKNHFSANRQEEVQSTRVGAVPAEPSFEYGSIQHLFKK